jgi:hypothetical protein
MCDVGADRCEQRRAAEQNLGALERLEFADDELAAIDRMASPQLRRQDSS